MASIVRGLNASELLEVWESGRGRSPVEQGLELLRMARPELDPDAQLALPLDERDLALFELRVRTFGEEARLRSRCAACDTELEASLDLTDVIRLGHEGAQATPEDRRGPRPPTSADLLAAAQLSPEEARRELAERCGATTADEGRALVERRPLLEVRIPLHCVDCGAVSEEPLDVVRFLWKELESHAVRLLHEVDGLARAYGWNEREILALSPVRRATYLTLASG